MFDNGLSFFGLSNDVYVTREDFRRKHVRYSGLEAEVTIGEHSYKVHDWDLNGIAFETAPEGFVNIGTNVDMNITFHLPQGTVTIEQTGFVLRIAKRGISVVVFTAVAPATRRQFERVLDSLYTQKFLESQVA